MSKIILKLSDAERIILFTDKAIKSRFDEINITLEIGTNRYTLFNDTVDEGLIKLCSFIDKTHNKKFQLPLKYVEKGIGYWWNKHADSLTEDCSYLEESDAFTKYWLWSTPASIGIETWMYNVGENTVIEISRNYPWHFEEPISPNQAEPFDEFIKDNKPLLLTTLDVSTILSWKSQCKQIISTIED